MGIDKSSLILMFFVVFTIAACSNGEISNTHDVDNGPKLVSEQQKRIKTMADTWKAAPLYTVPYDVLDPNLSVQVSVNAIFDPNDEYWGLPRSDGYELVYENCTGCHSVRIVMQQHATEARWDELLTWMVEKQNMPELTQRKRTQIIKYLTSEFGI
jgi:cytochrome c1